MTWTLDALLPSLDTAATVATLDGSGAGGTASAFTWSHSYSSPKKVKFRQREARFGDGYAQRHGVGINNIERMWDLRFNAKSEAVMLDIQDFLEARSDGIAFYWTPPYANRSNETIKVTCKEFQVNPAGYNQFDITATFEQVYGE